MSELAKRSNRRKNMAYNEREPTSLRRRFVSRTSLRRSGHLSLVVIHQPWFCRDCQPWNFRGWEEDDPTPFIFLPLIERRLALRQSSSKKTYRITLLYRNEMTREVTVKAVSREVAEQRALKHNPAAIGVKPRG